MIYDTHAHLNLNYSEEEIKETIQDSIKDNLYVNIVGIDVESSIRSIEISKMNPKFFFSIIGFHPIDVSKLSTKLIDEYITQLDELIFKNIKYVKGIGETGLDFFHTKDVNEIKMQYYSLKKHCELANKYNLPLILHVRDAHNEAIEYLKENKMEKVLIHCFSDKLIYAQEYIKLGHKISIPGIITFKNADELVKVVEKIDISNIFVETDCPYLAPFPYRYKKNYPQYTKYVVEKIANIKNEDYEVIAKTIFKNSLNFFNI